MLDFKRIITISVIICLLILGIFFIYRFIIEEEKEEVAEIVPQQEISEEQERQTIISLYFKSGDMLVPEARKIDVKELLNNPYESILNLLIEGPKNNKLEKIIPEGTKINKIQKEKNNLIIDFSTEFIDNHMGGEIEEKITINSIVNTLTELTEIDGIKILINGEENKSFKSGDIKFNKIFKREI